MSCEKHKLWPGARGAPASAELHVVSDCAALLARLRCYRPVWGEGRVAPSRATQPYYAMDTMPHDTMPSSYPNLKPYYNKTYIQDDAILAAVLLISAFITAYFLYFTSCSLFLRLNWHFVASWIQFIYLVPNLPLYQVNLT